MITTALFVLSTAQAALYTLIDLQDITQGLRAVDRECDLILSHGFESNVILGLALMYVATRWALEPSFIQACCWLWNKCYSRRLACKRIFTLIPLIRFHLALGRYIAVTSSGALGNVLLLLQLFCFWEVQVRYPSVYLPLLTTIIVSLWHCERSALWISWRPLFRRRMGVSSWYLWPCFWS